MATPGKLLWLKRRWSSGITKLLFPRRDFPHNFSDGYTLFSFRKPLSHGNPSILYYVKGHSVYRTEISSLFLNGSTMNYHSVCVQRHLSTQLDFWCFLGSNLHPKKSHCCSNASKLLCLNAVFPVASTGKKVPSVKRISSEIHMLVKWYGYWVASDFSNSTEVNSPHIDYLKDTVGVRALAKYVFYIDEWTTHYIQYNFKWNECF